MQRAFSTGRGRGLLFTLVASQLFILFIEIYLLFSCLLKNSLNISLGIEVEMAPMLGWTKKSSSGQHL